MVVFLFCLLVVLFLALQRSSSLRMTMHGTHVARTQIADLHRDSVAKLLGGLEQQWSTLVEFLKHVRVRRRSHTVHAVSFTSASFRHDHRTHQRVVHPLRECLQAAEAIGGLRSPSSLDRAADVVSHIRVVTQNMVSSAGAATASVQRDFDSLREEYAIQCANVQVRCAVAMRSSGKASSERVAMWCCYSVNSRPHDRRSWSWRSSK